MKKLSTSSAIKLPRRRKRTPTVIQMEAVECGAAALGIILGFHGIHVPLEKLRIQCGVSRDGSKAGNILRAAREYGLEAKGFKKEPRHLLDIDLPVIVFWNFNHFLVVEGFGGGKVYLNDPAAGPRTVTWDEFDRSFTGVTLTFTPTDRLVKTAKKKSFLGAVRKRFSGSKSALLYIFLTSVGLVIPGLLIPTFSRVFVDEIMIRGMQTWLKPLLVGMGLTLVLRLLLTWMQQSNLLRFENKLAKTTSGQFFWHILRLPIQFFSQRYCGEIGQRVMLNEQFATIISGQVATSLLSILMIIFYAVIMFQYDVLLTLFTILIAGFNYIFFIEISRKRRDANQKLLQDHGKLMATAMGGLQIIETIKATASENDFFSKWAGHHAKVLNAEQDLGVSVQWMNVFPVLMSGIATMFVLGVGGLRVMDGTLTIGMLIAFQILTASFLAPISSLISFGGQIQDLQGYLGRLDDVLNYPAVPVETRKVSNDTPKHKLTGHLELRNVTFGYSPLDPPLIENFSLVLKPGTRLALVGSSGSGKSTVSRLVAGLFEPWEGEILLDGKPRSQWPSELIHHSLSMVDQEIFLFQDRLRENLTLWDKTIPEANLVEAVQDADIFDVIADRPSGFDTPVLEGGANFSGGQRQRLEIARALANNPTILILDEATNALDPITEKRVDDNLRRRGCTCVIVAHRLSTIRDADEIIVLDRGQIVQRGTHDELKNKKGLYTELISAE